MNTSKIKRVALEIAIEVGKIHMRGFRKKMNIRWKGKTDPVTQIDVAAEKHIARRIKKAFPGHSMIGEEGEGFGDESTDFVWYCDPLDGTVNFSHGVPVFCVALGVYYKGKPIVGVVHAAALGETYWAEKGKGSYRNGKKIQVSKQKEPLHAVLASGFAYKAAENGENMREWMHMLRKFQAIRRLGSAAMDLCWVASGSYDGFWEYGLKPWDVAAAGFIVEEAGGMITNIEGKPYDMWKPGIVANNKKLHKPMLKTLKRALKGPLVWPPK